MKLTKTETALLAEATASAQGRIGIDHGSQGPSGRKRTFGTRRHQAAVSLVKKGLLTVVPESRSQAWLYGNNGLGINGVVYTSVWQLVK